MKNLSAEYWEKVETDSEKLFVEITKRNENIKKTDKENK